MSSNFTHVSLRYVRGSLAAVALFCASTSLGAAPHRTLDSIENLDLQINQTLQHLVAGEIKQARLMSSSMAWRFPDFALAQLLFAELESVAASNEVLIADGHALEHNYIDLLLEAKARLAAADAEPVQHTPYELVQAGEDVSQVILVDLNRSMLYQYDTSSDTPVLLRQHYAGSGKAGYGKLREGDNKTPLGVYSIVDFRADAALPELYGSGALTLDYPNALDRQLGRTGYGIWLHGVPRFQLSRSPRSSEGCVTMSNAHLTRLSRQVDISTTRIILTDSHTLVADSELKKLRTEYHHLFRRYQKAWTDKDPSVIQDLYRNTSANETKRTEDNLPVLRPAMTDQRFVSAGYLNALSSVESQDISIFLNPGISSTNPGQHRPDRQDTPEHLVMSARFGSNDEHQITVYWARSADDQWYVAAEHIQSAEI
ncbi:MAG: L,D-transpeptidase family protein [Granulosicoccus sp.]|nr:L,D-transpeptidase family protein [Granulosicoccus sp.]